MENGSIETIEVKKRVRKKCVYKMARDFIGDDAYEKVHKDFMKELLSGDIHIKNASKAIGIDFRTINKFISGDHLGIKPLLKIKVWIADQRAKRLKEKSGAIK